MAYCHFIFLNKNTSDHIGERELLLNFNSRERERDLCFDILIFSENIIFSIQNVLILFLSAISSGMNSKAKTLPLVTGRSRKQDLKALKLLSPTAEKRGI